MPERYPEPEDVSVRQFVADAVQSIPGLRAALEGVEPPDARFAEDIDAALGLLTFEQTDPWADA